MLRLCLLAVLLAVTAAGLNAQSLDPTTPAPIRSNNLLGRIAARDLGDSRLTDHYYAFTGTPGDLIITVESRNLNGDLDVFTAGTLRPLLKLTLYAERTTPVSKGIYLRKREALILRIEARSPNDDEGTYELLFRGSFEPIIGGPDVAENETAATETPAPASNRKTKRVSSVGARLPEPEPPVVEAASAPSPTPEATPSVTPVESASEKTTAEPEKTTTPRNTSRTRRPAGRRTSTPPPKPKETDVTVAEEAAKKEESGEIAEPTSKPKSVGRTSTRRTGTSKTRSTKSAPTPSPEPASEPESEPRLIIETNDGTLINRSMSSVRRVMVENGQVVVVGKDGKVDRIQLANVVRMSIAQ